MHVRTLLCVNLNLANQVEVLLITVHDLFLVNFARLAELVTWIAKLNVHRLSSHLYCVSFHTILKLPI